LKQLLQLGPGFRPFLLSNQEVGFGLEEGDLAFRGEFLWQLGQDVLRLLPLVFGDQGLGETEQFLFAQPGSVGQDLLVSRHGLGNQLLLA